MRITPEQRIFVVNEIIKENQKKLHRLVDLFPEIVDNSPSKFEAQCAEMEIEVTRLMIRGLELLKEELVEDQMRRRIERQERRQRRAREVYGVLGHHN